MTNEIVEKLRVEIGVGITKESQVVYILVGVRKLIEQIGNRNEFARLKFYCDWALHAKMSGQPAQDILQILDSIYKCMAKNEPVPENSKAMRLIRFDILKEDLSVLLRKFNLEDFTENTNTWVVFVYLFARVVQDCPLIIRPDLQTDIQKIVIQVETAKDTIDDDLPYKVNWKFKAKGDLPPALYFILNTYSVASVGRV